MSRLFVRFAAAAAVMALIGAAGCKKNHAPDAPDVSGPGLAEPGATLTFAVTTTDPDGDSVAYWIDWGDNTTPAWSPNQPSGEDYDVTHVYADSGAYYIRAKARDAAQAESQWSDSVRVSVGYRPPNMPFAPTGPKACTTTVWYDFKTRTTHPMGDSVAFQFYWGDTFGDWGPMVASGRTFTAPHVFDTFGMYKIAVRARDAHGFESGWSDSLRVRVGALHSPPGAPQNLTIAAATDSTVLISWTAPSGLYPDKYTVAFRQTGYDTFEKVGETTATSFVHNPAGGTGDYRVTAVYDDTAQYAALETPTTVPVWNSGTVVPELNGTEPVGYGWDRTTGQYTMYDMTVVDSAPKVDLYVTDFAQGSSGPDYYLASPFDAPTDPGGGIPAADWHITEYAYLDSAATENDPLPSYERSRYVDRRVIGPLIPILIACHTEDGYFALVNATEVDTVGGTATIETWFQLVPNLRLIQHY